jgi:hypothetical protein
MLKATVNGLQSLRRPEDVAKMRGKTIAEVLPAKRAEKETEAVAVAAVADEPQPEATEETVPAGENETA